MYLTVVAFVVFALVLHDDVEEHRLIEYAIMGQPYDSASGISIKIDKVSGGYARAFVSSDEGDETDVAYLQKIEGRWVVLDQGTGVNPHEIGIPNNW